ncbi:hypothetical protein [Desulfovibrio litoralis]|uniref:Uncharacterized protein n=1 Tax=Desulfovibrio litoralis DSM 11393 TaxID=1121455 RepID=A0A1M7SEZ4_9BACT|nr:hypothetical protein [Desulfovibrio litoralis]SHN57046.1 hypothetical protein SAMN02745728_00864 [Desulfovibrio litoralis DSM 11393]
MQSRQNKKAHENMLEFYRFKAVYDLFAQGFFDEAKAALASLQQAYISLCDENIVLKQQVNELGDILHLSQNLVLDGTVCWVIADKIKQGPYCCACFSEEGILSRLVETKDGWQCPHCGELLDKDDVKVNNFLNNNGTTGFSSSSILK